MIFRLHDSSDKNHLKNNSINKTTYCNILWILRSSNLSHDEEIIRLRKQCE